MSPGRAAALLVCAVSAAGAWHIGANASPPAWDDAWYLEVSFRLYSALCRGLPEFADQWASAFRLKAPLVSLLPLPLYALAGPSEKTAPIVSLLGHGLSCALTAAAARAAWREHPRRDAIAALAACLVALTPLLYGLSRVFLVESVLTALVAAVVWRAAVARSSPRDSLLLGLILGCGMLTKVLFPLFLCGVVWLKRRELAPHARPALLVGGALAATWYAFNLPYVVGFAWSAGFGRVAGDYAAGSRGPLAFPERLASQALSWPLACALAAAVAAAVSTERRGFFDAGTRLALAWAAPLAVFALGRNAEPRLFAPLLPALAMLGARAALSFGSKNARVAATLGLLAAGGLVFVRETFVAADGRSLAWCGAPSRDPGWDRAALLDAAATASGENGVAAVALEHRFLNANNLASLAAARGLPLRVIGLGYTQPSTEGALIHLRDRGATALILVDGAPTAAGADAFNRANAGVAAAVASGRLPAAFAASVELAPGITARVYRLVRPM